MATQYIVVPVSGAKTLVSPTDLKKTQIQARCYKWQVFET
jgi:hypothetical protein